MTYYNISKGRHVMMFVLDKQNNYYRVLANTDLDNTVLLKGDIVKLIPHNDVRKYRKFFEYVDTVQSLVKLELPETVKGESYIYYTKQKGGKSESGTS